ncbi:MAG TPA: hemerythrin domain-containing protein [Chloroflexi bacterium]|jgi:hemerythrin-like domain-containing protein|nr:hemerythrin domain-containing protein [Chloroflexota bacterium]
MSILDSIKQDHEHYKQTFQQLEQQSGSMQEKQQMFNELSVDLNSHIITEESIFYPELQRHEDTRMMAMTAQEEHNVAKSVLQELNQMSPDDDRWKAKFKVFTDLIQHHVEEEEGPIFSEAKNVLGDQKLQSMQSEWQSMKKEYMQELQSIQEHQPQRM